MLKVTPGLNFKDDSSTGFLFGLPKVTVVRPLGLCSPCGSRDAGGTLCPGELGAAEQSSPWKAASLIAKCSALQKV